MREHGENNHVLMFLFNDMCVEAKGKTYQGRVSVKHAT